MLEVRVEEDLKARIRAMVWKAIQNILGLNSASDVELLELLMRTALARGFGFDKLDTFRCDGVSCYGFFRDREHYTGVCRLRHVAGGIVYAIVARSTGRFDGLWCFMLDAERSIQTSRDGQTCEAFDALEGPDLVEAVVASALTEPSTARPREERSRWRPW